MRILKREKIAPIHLLAGDSLRLSWREFGHKTELLEQEIDRPMTIDVAAVAELSTDEAMQIGMTSAIAGIFGES